MKSSQNVKTVLALETSCDESAVALMSLESKRIKVIEHVISSQIKEHAQWGGVVPELASRIHLETIPYLIDEILKKTQTSFENIDSIAATVGPGLAGSLLIGSVSARALAALHGIPFMGIHHLEGHLASVLLSANPPNPPYLVLLVSGGHTELVRVDLQNSFQRLGRSHDDAAGEAFDKVGRLLGLSYPGGPEIEKYAKLGNPQKFNLPKGRVSRPEGGFYPYDFSFSGLKTAMLRTIEKLRADNEDLPIHDLAASFENIVADVLVERTVKCATDQKIDSIVMVGGVAANNRLRSLMISEAAQKKINVYLAPKAFCTDNAAMIGSAALIRLESGSNESSLSLGVSGRLPLNKAYSLYQTPPPF